MAVRIRGSGMGQRDVGFGLARACKNLESNPPLGKPTTNEHLVIPLTRNTKEYFHLPDEDTYPR